jgi:hypothetical protein
MNTEAIEKLMSMLPEGPKKEALRHKLNKLTTHSKKRGGDGLQDSFEFKPKGHIKIEAIDESGNVVDTLADQPNLVVDGAEEILLRSFSGDPNRILYKNRVPKTTPTEKIYIEQSKLAGLDLFDGNQLLHDPNILWSVVDDSNFDVTFGYYPIVVYVKEESSSEFGKKAFSVSKTPGAGFVPMSAETYSTYTNMFIGIGEGKNYPVDLTDSRLTYTEGFVPADGEAKTIVEGDEISFTQKISNFALEFEVSDKGAQIDVFINGVLKETIETLDSELTEPEIRTFEYTGLDNDVETEIRLAHSGSDSAVVDPEMKIKGLHFDALHKGMNSLMKEFKNYETDFLTPTSYNTTPMGPFTIQFANFPVKEGSVSISYNELGFTEVLNEEELSDNTFMVDHLHGIVRFNRALTGVMATYSTTGEIYDTELNTTMTSVNVSILTPTETPFSETPSGVVDDANKVFTLSKDDIKVGSVSVKINGSNVAVSNVDEAAKTVTLEVAPQTGDQVTVEYLYTKLVPGVVSANKYETEHSILEGSVKIFDHNGIELVMTDIQENFANGMFLVSGDKEIKIAQKDGSGEMITKIEVVYQSEELPGVPTNYTRAVIEKPKSINEYPWFELDKGAVRFVAEFPELKPSHNITIREMGLFDGPRVEDGIAGFRMFPVKAFSLVRVGETRKDVNTGIRITWTITLLNEEGNPFQGGKN